jgi:hypothetical protein
MQRGLIAHQFRHRDFTKKRNKSEKRTMPVNSSLTDPGVINDGDPLAAAGDQLFPLRNAYLAEETCIVIFHGVWFK